MMENTGSNPPLRISLRPGRMLDQLRCVVRARTGKTGSSAGLRSGFFLHDLADLSARTLAYLLAMLGLLHVLGLVAPGP